MSNKDNTPGSPLTNGASKVPLKHVLDTLPELDRQAGKQLKDNLTGAFNEIKGEAELNATRLADLLERDAKDAVSGSTNDGGEPAASEYNNEFVSKIGSPLDIFASTSIKTVTHAMSTNMLGLNTTPGTLNLAENKDKMGFVFFTRPQLNLQQSNIANITKLYSLLTKNPNSMQTQIRALLDPRQQTVFSMGGSDDPMLSEDTMKQLAYATKPLVANFVDPYNPFLSILTNTCISISGFPDISAETFSSKPGLHKETYIQYDDTTKSLTPIDLSCTFRNVEGDPITYLHYVWVTYGSSVFEGTMMPYIDYIAQNWIDYQTRIWRLVMDKDNRIVKKIAATLPAIPVSLPMGSFFDFNVETPYNLQNKEINIRFKTMGIEYMDDKLVREFNETVLIFNKNMYPEGNVLRGAEPRSFYMEKVHPSEINIFSHKSYPWINEETYELEWYVPKLVYKRTKEIMSGFEFNSNQP
jgi:hypothetical protein